jgi:DNA-binding MarR family transcriptional regulator
MSRDSKQKLMIELIEAVRANQTAVEAMDDSGARAMGVNRTDGRILDVISQVGRVSAGDLAQATGLTTGAVTAAIDRLHAKGYVNRVGDPDDRRRVLIEMTGEAANLAMQIWGPLADIGAPQLEKFTAEEMLAVIRFHRLSREINDKRAAEVRERLANEGFSAHPASESPSPEHPPRPH